MAQIIKMTKPIRFEVFDLIGWTVACYKQQWDCQKLNYPPGGLPDSSSENAKKIFLRRSLAARLTGICQNLKFYIRIALDSSIYWFVICHWIVSIAECEL